MSVEFRVLANMYFDSVYLMGVSGRLAKQAGVKRTAALMATPKNRALLEEFGVSGAAIAGAGPSDLVIAADADEPGQAASALALVDGWLNEEAPRPAGGAATSLESALELLPEAGLAVISVPGEYAAYEARRALERGLHVFLFSDNVALDDEIALKREAAARGLLMMGPDCGTALIAGAGIGFANAVRRGSIGIVGPSGTGIQQVSSLVHQLSAGVSHAIGTGSHDLSDDVGGITTFQALDALANDDHTAVIAIVSKPPGPATKQRVLQWIAGAPKPVVTCFLGPEATPRAAAGHHPTRTLAEAALRSAALSGHDAGAPIPSLPVEPLLAGYSGSQRYVRGMFAGGSFCYEAQQVFLDAGLDVRSNAPLRPELRLADPLRGEGHCMVDLGDDVFTQGRPHPMIDATLRNERIVAEAADPTVAVLLLDFVLGRGAAADPAGDTAPAIVAAQTVAIEAGRRLTVVASVCGTDADPQDRAAQVRTLEGCGVVVLPSCSAAAELASALAAAIARRDPVGA